MTTGDKYTPEFLQRIADYYNDHTIHEIEHEVEINPEFQWKGKPILIRSVLYHHKDQMTLVTQEQRQINIVLRYYDKITEYRKYYSDWVKRINTEFHLGTQWVSVYKRLKNTKSRNADIRNKYMLQLKNSDNPTSVECCKLLQCAVAREVFTDYLDEFETKYPKLQIEYDVIRTLIVELEKRVYQKGLPYMPKKVCYLALICYALLMNPNNHYGQNQFTKNKVITIFHVISQSVNKDMKELFKNHEFGDFLTIFQYRIQHSHSILSQPINLFDP